MANLLKSKLSPAAVARGYSCKGKLKAFPQRPGSAAKFDDVAEEAPRGREAEERVPPPRNPYDYSNSVRYRVCQERVPVHKMIRTTPTSYEQVRQALNLQSLQPALLPEFYAKSGK